MLGFWAGLLRCVDCRMVWRCKVCGGDEKVIW